MVYIGANAQQEWQNTYLDLQRTPSSSQPPLCGLMIGKPLIFVGGCWWTWSPDAGGSGGAWVGVTIGMSNPQDASTPLRQPQSATS